MPVITDIDILRNREAYPLTVVIATLGGDTLAKTVEQLNRGTVVPAEILICIPEEESVRAEHLLLGNVKIVRTACRGQVAQRAVGFRTVSHDVVMQLDDDMIVDTHCVECLLKTILAYGPNVSVAPSLINRATGKSVYMKPERSTFLQNLYYWLMNGHAGYKPGRIDKSGSAVGIDTEAGDKELYDVEWLAGGCVMHHRNGLVLENYWPLKGKAYYEDVMHSFILKSKGVRLLVDSRAVCSLELFYVSSYGPRDFINNLVADYRRRKYVMERCSRKSFRIYLYYLASILSYVSKKMSPFDHSSGPVSRE